MAALVRHHTVIRLLLAIVLRAAFNQNETYNLPALQAFRLKVTISKRSRDSRSQNCIGLSVRSLWSCQAPHWTLLNCPTSPCPRVRYVAVRAVLREDQ
jgi:hypothetical protein